MSDEFLEEEILGEEEESQLTRRGLHGDRVTYQIREARSTRR